jgi:BirA family transcriptional regulator, biotin operon repressor / biotin---[acetyl-CoA-carboxylase] ligase
MVYCKVPETRSTNEYLKTLLKSEDLPDGYLVATPNQTHGRGQKGAVWESEPGKNLTFSLLLRPTALPADKLFLVSKCVSLGIIDYLNQINTAQFQIKWPNDIYYQNKKIAGILIENQIMGPHIKYSVCGIGLNVNQLIFNPELPNPISMAIVFNREFDLEQTLTGVIGQIKTWMGLLEDGFYEKIDEAYHRCLYRHEGYHDFKTEEGTHLHATIIKVDPDGQLILKDNTGTLSGYYFKQIEFL